MRIALRSDVERLRRERDAYALQAQYFADLFYREQEAHAESLREMRRVLAAGSALAEEARGVVADINAIKETLA